MQKYTAEDLEREQKGETGFQVYIEYSCPHLQAGVNKNLTMQEYLNAFSKCSQCDEKEENWFCLQCGGVFCSRYKNSHMAKHYQQSKHCIAVSTADLSTWCYECDSYVESKLTREIRLVMQQIKFGDVNIKKNNFDSTTTTKPKNNSTSHKTDEEVEEHFDDPAQVEKDAKMVAQLIKQSKHVVIYTGAGISTSANIPDYRGPKGVWTLRDKGISAEGIDIEQAWPTYAHYALTHLIKQGLVHYVISTNVDGLHRRSGVAADKLAELHGNCYKEVCSTCQKEYLRGYDTTKTVKNYTNHITGRKCSCGGMLKDTIIHFSENLPQKELEDAYDNSEKADLAIVLGTSMRVAPANKLPMECVKKGGKMIIVNLQWTPYDAKAHKKVHAKTDPFMQIIMKELGFADFDQTYDALQHLPK